MRIEFVDICTKCGFLVDEMAHCTFYCPIHGKIGPNSTTRVISLTLPNGTRKLFRAAS